ncbi:sulfatase-like hydrolase/transferase [candidate division KSB1 bacterium]|nr:sulfatase-like hydrolase/transferase [candidate division KSB1 bacterium]RQW01599.1 MAG: sulfatase [candidate division KSB1 bacterium]
MLNSRRQFMRAVLGTAGACFAGSLHRCAADRDRPNILCITSEDNSPFFGCYGDAFATTPNFDRFAQQGILYENVFATAPVCAPARCTIITGVYPPSMGTQHMRSRYPIPDVIKPYPMYLREAGYYCTNNAKTDYNFHGEDGSYWDESGQEAHYKNRPQGMPFFAIFNYTVSHESSVHSSIPADQLRHDPGLAPLPPYHPDTPVVRHDWAQYYDKIEDLDALFGERLQELEEAGLAEETIVIYFADHGGVLARSKRYLYDSGLHVPMIIRFPPKYRHLAPASPGARIDQLITFIDFPATFLSLAGIAVPRHMQGTVFLGKQKGKPRKYAHSFRDRMDEKYDFSRTIRDKQFRYVRHYNPQRIFGQYLEYLWRAPLTRSWEEEFLAGRCNDVQRKFWRPKPFEELFDSRNDPWEVHNLAATPHYRQRLVRMRADLRNWLLEIRDSGFLPEGALADIAQNGTVYDYVHSAAYELERILPVAEMATDYDAAHLPDLCAAMADANPTIRFWGAMGCLVLGDQAGPAIDDLFVRLKDPDGDVVAVAAEAVVKLGFHKEGVDALIGLLAHANGKVVLRAVNALEQIGDYALPALPVLKTELAQHQDDYVVRAAKHLSEILG